VNADLPDVIEIWNNVFIQFNREADGTLRSLPAQHVDTGMGFERLTSILQNVDSNYDTDIFIPIFDAISRITNARPYQGKVGIDDAPEYIDMAYRVVADHIRTLSFAIADGAIPSNDGRGYVLRRILRRAVRYGRQTLGAELGFFAQLVPTVVDLMGEAFPELVIKQEHVTNIIREEEESFSRTLDKGLLKFKEVAAKVGAENVLSGEDAHYLYTTMGFPIDLTALMAEEKGLTVDMAAFESKMEEEKERSAAAHVAKMAAGSGKDMRMVAEQMAYLVDHEVPATNDDAKYIWHQNLSSCSLKAIFIGRNETEDGLGFVMSARQDHGMIGLVLDKTNFYAEAGGQIYDTGTISTTDGGVKFQVENVQMFGQFVLHLGHVLSVGELNIGDSLTTSVDYIRRAPIAANHTLTHVLNHALRQVLVLDAGKDPGTVSIDQKGSLVDECKLRFDFSWNGPLQIEQLSRIEELCQEKIDMAVPVNFYVAPLDKAQKISSLRAVFGEKYPDPVRVVAVSDHSITDMLSNPQDAMWNAYSVEFCGGTHLANTKEAKAFVLLYEEGIAKGIRRIVALTMDDAQKAMVAAENFEAKLSEAMSVPAEKLDALVKVLSTELNSLSISATKKEKFRNTLKELSKKVVAYQKERMQQITDEAIIKVIDAALAATGLTVVVHVDFGIEGKVAKSITTAYSKKVSDKALCLISGDTESDKFLVVTFSPSASIPVDCKAWAMASVEGTDGKGGGRPDSAQYTVVGLHHMDVVIAKAQIYV
jgi:alanyl-tRNA synthetase